MNYHMSFIVAILSVVCFMYAESRRDAHFKQFITHTFMCLLPEQHLNKSVKITFTCLLFLIFFHWSCYYMCLGCNFLEFSIVLISPCTCSVKLPIEYFCAVADKPEDQIWGRGQTFGVLLYYQYKEALAKTVPRYCWAFCKKKHCGSKTMVPQFFLKRQVFCRSMPSLFLACTVWEFCIHVYICIW